MAPDGRGHCYWVQNDVRPVGSDTFGYTVDGWVFDDLRHAEWRMICDRPDADKPMFGDPALLDIGFLGCKSLVTSTGRLINFNYDQLCDRYGYSLLDDGGRSYTRYYGATKLPIPFDETMAYQQKDGTIRMLAPSVIGQLAESFSYPASDFWHEKIDLVYDHGRTAEREILFLAFTEKDIIKADKPLIPRIISKPDAAIA